MSIAYDAGGPEFESHRTWIYHNEVYLEAPDGQRFPVNDGFDTTAQADGGVAGPAGSMKFSDMVTT